MSGTLAFGGISALQDTCTCCCTLAVCTPVPRERDDSIAVGMRNGIFNWRRKCVFKQEEWATFDWRSVVSAECVFKSEEGATFDWRGLF